MNTRESIISFYKQNGHPVHVAPLPGEANPDLCGYPEEWWQEVDQDVEYIQDQDEAPF